MGVIGPYPPPYGGVSVHIQRLLKRLEQLNFVCNLYDVYGKKREKTDERIVRITSPKLWVVKYFFTCDDEIIHIHTEDWRSHVMVGLMAFLGKKTIATLHSEIMINRWKNFNFIKKRLIRFALKSNTRVIAVNQAIFNYCLSLGVHTNNLFLIPAFLPPVIEEADRQEIPAYVCDFLTSHKPILSANAAKINFFKEQDLYGLDLCIELCYRLKENYDTIGFIFFLSEIGDKNYFDELQLKIRQLHIQKNFLFVTESCTFYPVLMKSDIFIRPTNTDGDAISVREALFFKIPTIVSDCVPRPEGTILFSNRNADDLTIKTTNLLNDYHQVKETLDRMYIPDNGSEVTDIYQKIFTSKGNLIQSGEDPR